MLKNCITSDTAAGTPARPLRSIRRLSAKFAAAMIDHVPSSGARPINNNIFFEMEDGSYICFFDILGSDDAMVPVADDWAQHLALEVSDDACRTDRIQAARTRHSGRGTGDP